MSEPQETLQIATPENVSFGYEIAGIGSRFLAAIIDTTFIFLLQALTIFILVLVASSGVNSASRLTTNELFSGSSWVLAVIGIISFLFFWGYYIFFEILWNGQSPGKKIFKLRVIRREGTPITPSEAVIRNLVRLVDFLPLYYGIGVIIMFVDPQARRLGDLAAGTLVVHDSGANITLASLAAQPAAPALPTAGERPALPLLLFERLSNQDILVIESFLNRRRQLTNRGEMALRIARSILADLSQPDNLQNGAQAEEFLIQVWGEYQRARGS